MTVAYRVERTGRGPHKTHEVLVTRACPSCGAAWPGAAKPRPGSRRSYWCTACDQIHDATPVDDEGRPMRSPGWALARELREHDEGPGRHPEG